MAELSARGSTSTCRGCASILPSVTKKDREDIAWAIEQDLDFIALSFVRGAEDLLEAREIIDARLAGTNASSPRSKTKKASTTSMRFWKRPTASWSRGVTSASRSPSKSSPCFSGDMIRRCAIAGKPIIVATHLLESMIENPLPTRAEVTDVANAVYEQADAIMLSGETAAGKYPVRCVEVLDTIARRIETGPGLDFYKERPAPTTQRAHVAQSACRLADSLGARAIVVMTRRGYFGQLVASYRPRSAIIYAFTNMSTTRRKLWLNRAVIPFRMNLSRDPEKTIVNALAKLRERAVIEAGEPVVVVSDVATATGDLVTSIQVRVSE